MEWLEKSKVLFLDQLVNDDVTQILDETAIIGRKLHYLQYFPKQVRDAIAFFIAIYHVSGTNFFQIDLQTICDELGVSPDILLAAGNHWAKGYNYPSREDLSRLISEMALFFYGEQENVTHTKAQ